MICEKCGKEFFEDYRKDKQTRKSTPRFCSVACSHARVQSEATKNKVSNSLISFYSKDNKDSSNRKRCRVCGNLLALNNNNDICIYCKGSQDKANKREYNKNRKKICIKCGKKISYNNISGLCKICKDEGTIKKSRSERVIKWRKNKKIKLVEYKGGKCEICGYNKCIEALEFHHRNPEEKEFHISHKNVKNIEIYFKEVDKCILVCANCHREIHAGIIEINQEDYNKQE